MKTSKCVLISDKIPDMLQSKSMTTIKKAKSLAVNIFNASKSVTVKPLIDRFS